METKPFSVPTEPAPIDSLVRYANDTIGRKSRFIRDLLREDILDLALVPIDPQVGDQEIQDCTTHVRLWGQVMQPLVQRIPAWALEDLFFLASSMYSKGNHYVSGLKIYFGANSAGKGMAPLFPVYCPLYMERVSQDVATGLCDYAPEEGPLFVFEAGRFREVEKSEADKYTQCYKQEVTIKHAGENDFTPFRPGQDVESLIFPFQTIFTLMSENETEEVYLYNAIRPINNGIAGIWECILLLPQETEVFFYGNSMKGKYANRSKLCPPDCSVLQYEVDIIR